MEFGYLILKFELLKDEIYLNYSSSKKKFEDFFSDATTLYTNNLVANDLKKDHLKIIGLDHYQLLEHYDQFFTTTSTKPTDLTSNSYISNIDKHSLLNNLNNKIIEYLNSELSMIHESTYNDIKDIREFLTQLRQADDISLIEDFLELDLNKANNMSDFKNKLKDAIKYDRKTIVKELYRNTIKGLLANKCAGLVFDGLKDIGFLNEAYNNIGALIHIGELQNKVSDMAEDKLSSLFETFENTLGIDEHQDSALQKISPQIDAKQGQAVTFIEISKKLLLMTKNANYSMDEYTQSNVDFLEDLSQSMLTLTQLEMETAALTVVAKKPELATPKILAELANTQATKNDFIKYISEQYDISYENFLDKVINIKDPFILFNFMKNKEEREYYNTINKRMQLYNTSNLKNTTKYKEWLDENRFNITPKDLKVLTYIDLSKHDFLGIASKIHNKQRLNQPYDINELIKTRLDKENITPFRTFVRILSNTYYNIKHEPNIYSNFKISMTGAKDKLKKLNKESSINDLNNTAKL